MCRVNHTLLLIQGVSRFLYNSPIKKLPENRADSLPFSKSISPLKKLLESGTIPQSRCYSRIGRIFPFSSPCTSVHVVLVIVVEYRHSVLARACLQDSACLFMCLRMCVCDSWSLSPLGYIYPETTPVVIKLGHNWSCLWV